MEAKTYAAAALCNLACNDEIQRKIANTEDGIPALIAVLKEGSEEAKIEAVGALRNLTENNTESQWRIAEADGIPTLLALLTEGSDDRKSEAAKALLNLTSNDAVKKIIRSEGLSAIRSAHDQETNSDVKSILKELLNRFKFFLFR